MLEKTLYDMIVVSRTRQVARTQFGKNKNRLFEESASFNLVRLEPGTSILTYKMADGSDGIE